MYQVINNLPIDYDFQSKTKEELKLYAKWFEENVETEKLSEEEYKEKKAAVPDYIEIKDWDITIKTRSSAVDIGIYFGEVFIKNHKGLKWEQYFSRSKYDMDIGHMVIKGFGKDVLNSIWIIYVLASGLAKKTKKGTRLYELYNVWNKI